MTKAGNHRRPPEPHPDAATLAVSVMAVVVAAVLEVLGPGRRLDAWVASLADGFRLEGDARWLHPGFGWGWGVVMTVGVCWAVLHVAGNWRRAVVAVTALVVTLTWVPVLALAGYRAGIAFPLVALLWGCVGSMVYAARHRELDD